MSPKPKLFLIPAYIGSFKYFARFWPRLSEYYEVEFLLVRLRDKRRDQMVEYAQENRLPYQVLDQGLSRSRFRLPFWTPVWKRFCHIRACRKFIARTRPAKMILMKALPPHDVIVREAARAGIEVIILQWSFHHYDPALALPKDSSLGRYRRVYFSLITVLLWLVDFVYVGPHYVRSFLLPSKIGVFEKRTVAGYAVSYNFPRDRITVVGNADCQIVRELGEQITADQNFKKSLLGKYGIDPVKKQILIVANGFHLRTWTGKTLDYQLEYYGKIINHLRSFISKADILVKLHPSDNPAFYERFKNLGIKVYGDEAKTEELICLSRLIISGVWTTTNYMVTASGLPAIFENFTPWQNRNTFAGYYEIKRVITDWETFDQALRDWQKGALPLQYDFRLIRRDAIDEVIALVRQ